METVGRVHWVLPLAFESKGLRVRCKRGELTLIWLAGLSESLPSLGLKAEKSSLKNVVRMRTGSSYVSSSKGEGHVLPCRDLPALERRLGEILYRGIPLHILLEGRFRGIL